MNPYWVPLVKAELAGSPVKVCTVVGFPLGATSTEAKVAETAAAAARRRAGDRHGDQRRRAAFGRYRCREERHSGRGARWRTRRGAIVKVILETALLDDNQKAVACTICKAGRRGFREDLHRLLPPPAPPRTTSL